MSALESKKWSNHKIKAHYNDFDTIYVQIILNVIRSRAAAGFSNPGGLRSNVVGIICPRGYNRVN